jgi:hypothetical protein
MATLRVDTDGQFFAVKTPTEVVRYDIDWSNFLGAETISTSAWAAQTGVTLGTTTNTTKIASAIISSGTAGQSYKITNTITTSGGQTFVRGFELRLVAP